MSDSYQSSIMYELGKSEVKTLSLLYGPIIGNDAKALYMQLYFDCVNAEGILISFDNNHLKLLLNLTDDQILENRRKLEAVGLITTLYSTNERSFLIEVNQPLDPYNFFNNEILNSELVKKLGSDEYEKIRFMFRDISQKTNVHFDDVSASMNDVFGDKITIVNLNDVSQISIPSHKNDVYLSKNDLNEIASILKKYDISFSSLGKKTLENIEKAKFMFKLTNLNIAKIVRDLYKNDGPEIKYVDIVNAISITLNTSPYIKDDKLSDKVSKLEKTDPANFLKSRLGLTSLDDKYLRLIYELKNTHRLNNGVINVLLDFSYLKNEKKIVQTYVLKIANTLSEMNINNVSDAMSYLKNAFIASSTKKPFVGVPKKRKTYEQEIEWTDEELKAYYFQDITLPDDPELIRRMIK